MPLITDVSFPSLIEAETPKKKKRPAYGYTTPSGKRVKLGRAPTAFEQRVLSIDTIPDRLDAETLHVCEALALVRRDQLESATSSVAARNLAADVQEIFLASLSRVTRYGAFELRQEHQRQGASYHLTDERAADFDYLAPLINQATRLRTVLALTSARVVTDWTEALLLAEGPRHARTTPAGLADLAARRLETGLKMAARAMVNSAFAMGRSFELKHKKADPDFDTQLLVFTSVLDANTCEDCAHADGTTFASDSDEADIMAVPYYKCQGGELCRCQVLSVGYVDDLSDHLTEVLTLRGRSA